MNSRKATTESRAKTGSREQTQNPTPEFVFVILKKKPLSASMILKSSRRSGPGIGSAHWFYEMLLHFYANCGWYGYHTTSETLEIAPAGNPEQKITNRISLKKSTSQKRIWDIIFAWLDVGLGVIFIFIWDFRKSPIKEITKCVDFN